MSFFTKLISLFKRNSKTALPEKQEEVTVVTPPAHSAPTDNVIYIYSHGFTNGVYKVEAEKENFQEFLKASSEADKIMVLRRNNQQQLSVARQQLVSKETAARAVQDIF